MKVVVSIIIWVLRIALACLFMFVGALKFRSDPQSVWVAVFAKIGIGQWFRIVTGIIEVIGGALLLWPRATRFAVLLLSATMIGALVTHVFIMGIGPQTVFVCGVLAALAILAFVAKPSRSSG